MDRLRLLTRDETGSHIAKVRLRAIDTKVISADARAPEPASKQFKITVLSMREEGEESCQNQQLESKRKERHMGDTALLEEQRGIHKRPLRFQIRLFLTFIGKITDSSTTRREFPMNVASDVRVTSHQERLNHDLVRQDTEMGSFVNMHGDTRRRQSITRTTVNCIEDLRGVELLTPIIDSVEHLPENCLISILHDRRRNRDISKPPGHILDMRGILRSIRIVSQPRQCTSQIEQVG